MQGFYDPHGVIRVHTVKFADYSSLTGLGTTIKGQIYPDIGAHWRCSSPQAPLIFGIFDIFAFCSPNLVNLENLVNL